MVTTTAVWARHTRTALVVGSTVVVVYATGLAWVLERGTRDQLATIILAPILVALSLPTIFRQADRERDPRTAWILCGALVVKLLGGLVRYGVAFGVYGGASDARAYWNRGVVIGADLRRGVVDLGFGSLSGTSFVRVLAGITSAVVGPSLVAGFLIFAWLGFWGLFLWYRAFTIAVPHGDRRRYAALVFFLPSLLFWPSSVGKEAWMMLALGLVAFGAARLLSGRSVNGLVYIALGLIAAAVVRPPVAGIAAIALSVAALVRPSPPRFRELAPVVKVIGLGALVAISFALVARSDAFLERAGIRTSDGISGVLSQTSNRTGSGGSRFDPSIVTSPWDLPGATVTVLFRPLVSDATGTTSMLAALEGTLVLGLCIVGYRRLLRALSLVRAVPFIAFSVVYLALFVFAFSGIANYGLLVRERVQVLPALLVLLSVPAVRSGPERRRR